MSVEEREPACRLSHCIHERKNITRKLSSIALACACVAMFISFFLSFAFVCVFIHCFFLCLLSCVFPNLRSCLFCSALLL